jgi:hypothetical protein
VGRKPATKSEFAARVFEADQAAGAEPVSSPDTPPIVPAACFAPFDLEEAFMADWGAKIYEATPCQRAICRLLAGKPLAELVNMEHHLIDRPRVLDMFGGQLPDFEGPPEVAMVLSGIRTAKSTVIALMAIWLTQTIDLPEWIRESDEVRIPILSVDIETARPTFSHVRDTILGSPRLSGLLARDEKGKVIEPKTDSLLLRHPSGKHIEIKVVAINRAGSSLTARWFAGAIFDECPRLGSEVEFIRSFDESYRACLGRMLPGGIIMLGGSPHARTGPIYEMFRQNFGKPTPKLVVLRAKAYWLNPIWWTPERREAMRVKDAIMHQTDVECEFRDPEHALGDSESIEKAMRKTPGNVEPIKGHHYVATMDPATRVNTWTFTILECVGLKGPNMAYRVAFNDQWVPSPGRSLSPDYVLGEIAAHCKRYGITEVTSDIASADALTDIAATKGIELTIETGIDLLELGRELMTLIRRELLELPEDGQMREDLATVRTRTSSNGGVTIMLPKAAGGRHCDYFPALCLAVKNLPDPPDGPSPKLDLDALDLQRELAEFDERNDSDGNEAARRLCGH